MYKIILLFLCSSVLNAVDLDYSYDANGNRISTIITVYAKKANPTVEDVANYSITLFPNPSSGVMELNINGLVNESITSYEIIDLTGNLIQKLSDFQSSTLIDISNYSNGVYFLKISIDDKNTVWKIIKEE